MKQWICLLTLALPLWGEASLCQNMSDEAKAYQQQMSWREVDLTEKNSPISVKGFVDQQDVIHLDELNFNGSMMASMTVSQEGRYSDYFYHHCRQPDADPGALTTLRNTGKGPQIEVNLSYLPQLDQAHAINLAPLNTTHFEVHIDYQEDAMVNSDYAPQNAKRMIRQRIANQLDDRKPKGSYQLDLTQMDDFACDLLHGKASLRLYRKMAPVHTFKRKVEVVSPESFFSVVDAWKQVKAQANSLTETLFFAGASFQKLKDQGAIESIGPVQALQILDQWVEPLTGNLRPLPASEAQCLLDSMQDYRSEITDHHLMIQLQFDKDQTLGK
jgi:hypothetical protein